MTATNHVLTGAIIGLTIHQPGLAIILALMSHFVLDALPHYGDNNHTKRRFITVFSLDILLSSVVLFLLFITHPQFWQLAVMCAVAASSPDLMWLGMWVRELQRLPAKRAGLIKRFHKRIQWGEKAQNYPYEVAWAFACILILVKAV